MGVVLIMLLKLLLFDLLFEFGFVFEFGFMFCECGVGLEIIFGFFLSVFFFLVNGFEVRIFF